MTKEGGRLAIVVGYIPKAFPWHHSLDDIYPVWLWHLISTADEPPSGGAVEFGEPCVTYWWEWLLQDHTSRSRSRVFMGHKRANRSTDSSNRGERDLGAPLGRLVKRQSETTSHPARLGCLFPVNTWAFFFFFFFPNEECGRSLSEHDSGCVTDKTQISEDM